MIGKKANAYITLIKRLAIVGGIVAAAILLWRMWPGKETEAEFTIDETPLRVEQVREIIELNTINFRDEVVVDSVEYYKNSTERLVGTSQKFQQDLTLDISPIKRRLTLIVKGELIYGINLKKRKMEITQTDSTVVITLPQPQLLTVGLSPANTEVFVENGNWQDYERIHLQNKAKRRMILSGERLRLAEKAKEPVERLLRNLVKTSKKVIIAYR